MPETNLIILILVAVFFSINLYSFIITVFDKRQAKNDKPRVSEASLFFMSICFGALGVLIGMKFSRHKTKKMKFIIGIPLALIQNIVLFIFIYWIYLKIRG